MKKHTIFAAILFVILGFSGTAKADPLMFLPFQYGAKWYCTQGQGGSYSHQGNQYYGFDFNKGSNSNSSSNPAFGEPLYSPVNGEVVEIRDGVHDFTNNSSSNADNNWGWGNTVVIEDEEGVYFVRLAHFRYGTTNHLHVGDWVQQGDYLGQVGQTGYSTSPHLHIQIMTSSRGSSRNFKFVEGDIRTGDWVRSRLNPRMSALDNNREKSLSHWFSYASAYSHGNWYTSRSRDWYAGRNYARHRVVSSNETYYFKWRFRMANSGYYAIYATFPPSSSNEPRAEYFFGTRKVRTIDQRSNPSHMRYITTRYLSASTTYYLRVMGNSPGKYLIADAVILKKL